MSAKGAKQLSTERPLKRLKPTHTIFTSTVQWPASVRDSIAHISASLFLSVVSTLRSLLARPQFPRQSKPLPNPKLPIPGPRSEVKLNIVTNCIHTLSTCITLYVNEINKLSSKKREGNIRIILKC